MVYWQSSIDRKRWSYLTKLGGVTQATCISVRFKFRDLSPTFGEDATGEVPKHAILKQIFGPYAEPAGIC